MLAPPTFFSPKLTVTVSAGSIALFVGVHPSASSDLPDHVRQAIGTVQTSFLAAAFEAIDADYGDLESYLRDGLGLGKAERAHLEARYLQR